MADNAGVIVIRMQRERLYPLIEAMSLESPRMWSTRPTETERQLEVNRQLAIGPNAKDAYEPIVKALQNGKSTLEEISQYTGRKLWQDEMYIEAMKKAELLEEQGWRYKMSDDCLELVTGLFNRRPYGTRYASLKD